MSKRSPGVLLALLLGTMAALILTGALFSVERPAPPVEPDLLAAAQAHFDGGRYADAVSVCLRGLEAERPETRFLELLPQSSLKLGKVDDAIRAYMRLAARRPGEVEDLVTVCELCVKRGDLEKLGTAAAEILKRDEKHLRGRLWAAKVCESRGDLRMAIEHTRIALKLDDARLKTHLDLARLLEANGESRKAERAGDGNYDLVIKNYDDVLDIDPGNPVAVIDRADMMAERGDKLDKAKTMAKALVSRFPDDPDALDTYGWVCYKRGEIDEAIEAFPKSLAIRKDHATTLYHLGLALLHKGQKEAARGAMVKALKADPRFPEAAKTRELLDAMGRRRSPELTQRCSRASIRRALP